jgi:hypothetical protein
VNEERRRARNAARLEQLHPAFARRIRAVIGDLEASGLRPRIQDAWRDPAAQLRAYERGLSRLKFGFHNLTGPDGRPEALAADILDDDHPAHEGAAYLLQLAAAAESHDCVTGVRWGLPSKLRAAVDAAIASHDWQTEIKIGWDPCHVQPADLTLAQAKKGRRPA